MEAPSWTNFFRENEYSRKEESRIEHNNFVSWRSLERRRKLRTALTSSVPHIRSSGRSSGYPAYGDNEIITTPCQHTPHRYSGEMRYFAPYTANSNRGRALPPIPTDDYKSGANRHGDRTQAATESALANGYAAVVKKQVGSFMYIYLFNPNFSRNYCA